MTKYTRRKAYQLSPEILGRYHGLVCENRLAEFLELLETYQPEMPEEVKQELIQLFKQTYEQILRRRWLSRK